MTEKDAAVYDQLGRLLPALRPALLLYTEEREELGDWSSADVDEMVEVLKDLVRGQRHRMLSPPRESPAVWRAAVNGVDEKGCGIYAPDARAALAVLATTVRERVPRWAQAADTRLEVWREDAGFRHFHEARRLGDMPV